MRRLCLADSWNAVAPWRRSSPRMEPLSRSEKLVSCIHQFSPSSSSCSSCHRVSASFFLQLLTSRDGGLTQEEVRISGISTSQLSLLCSTQDSRGLKDFPLKEFHPARLSCGTCARAWFSLAEDWRSETNEQSRCVLCYAATLAM